MFSLRSNEIIIQTESRLSSTYIQNGIGREFTAIQTSDSLLASKYIMFLQCAAECGAGVRLHSTSFFFQMCGSTINSCFEKICLLAQISVRCFMNVAAAAARRSHSFAFTSQCNLPFSFAIRNSIRPFHHRHHRQPIYATATSNLFKRREL